MVPEWALDADIGDCAPAELASLGPVRLGAVQVEHRWAGQQRPVPDPQLATPRRGLRSTSIAAAGDRTKAATPTDAAEGGLTNRGMTACSR